MSNMRVVKSGSPIELPNDDVVVEIKVMMSGKMSISAPTMHPRDLCKLLAGIQYDLMYASLQPQEIPKIQPVQ